MKKVIKSGLIVILAVLMVVSSVIIVAAEETTNEDGVIIVTVQDNETGSTRAYELVWKYRIYHTLLQKRRWNLTTDEWYDPYWMPA